jgi:hypothetical protein
MLCAELPNGHGARNGQNEIGRSGAVALSSEGSPRERSENRLR